MFISWDAYLAYKMPRTPAALCMWLEHRPQCSTWSNRQMGVSHSIAMMERNYPAECCPPSHTTSNSLDAQYSPNHSIFLVMTALSIGQDSLMHWNDHMWFEQWLRYCMTFYESPLHIHLISNVSSLVVYYFPAYMRTFQSMSVCSVDEKLIFWEKALMEF